MMDSTRCHVIMSFSYWVCHYQYSKRHSATSIRVTPAAGRKSLSDVHYAKQCGGRLCALNALQLWDMGAGGGGCQDTHFSLQGDYFTGNWT